MMMWREEEEGRGRMMRRMDEEDEGWMMEEEGLGRRRELSHE